MEDHTLNVRFPAFPLHVPQECEEEGSPHDLLGYASYSLLFDPPQYRMDLVAKAIQQFESEPRTRQESLSFKYLAAAVHGYVMQMWLASIEREGCAVSSVYFIKDGSKVKIGYSNNPEDRLKNLQCGHASTLILLKTIPGGREEESALHSRFSHLRLKGEWFKLAPEIQSFIDQS